MRLSATLFHRDSQALRISSTDSGNFTTFPAKRRKKLAEFPREENQLAAKTRKPQPAPFYGLIALGRPVSRFAEQGEDKTRPIPPDFLGR